MAETESFSTNFLLLSVKNKKTPFLNWKLNLSLQRGMDSSNDCCYEDELIILREKVELLGTKFRTLREDLDNEFNECKQKKHEE